MPRDRLSALDASFLYLNGPVTTNQAVGLHLLEGPVDFERVVEDIRRKVRFADRLRQVPVFTPLNLFHPTWEFDPAFEIRRHVLRVAVEPAGDAEAFTALVERIFAEPLPMDRSPWRVYVVEGLLEGRTAHLLVLHHCMTDGVGFSQLAHVFFDLEQSTQFEPWTPPPVAALPSGARRLLSGLIDSARQVFAIRLDRDFCRAAFGREYAEARQMLRRFGRASGVRFPFNAPLSGEASYTCCRFALSEMHAIRARHGGTINDIVLALVGSVLHRYACARGIETDERYLRVLVPSNMRTDENRDSMGNFVSMAPVLVPLAAMPVADRLRRVSEYTAAMKACGLARVMGQLIAKSQSALPPPLSRLSHRLYSSLWMQRRELRKNRTPAFNIVVTNVAGSTVPTYVSGAKLAEAYVLVPLLASIGLVCGAISHNGTLYVSFTGDKATVPDIGVLSTHLEEAFSELLFE